MKHASLYKPLRVYQQTRCSDADREAALTAITRNLIEGRIDLDEHEERIQHVLGADTLDQLRYVVNDLPVRVVDPPVETINSTSPRRVQPIPFNTPPAYIETSWRWSTSLWMLVWLAVILTFFFFPQALQMIAEMVLGAFAFTY